MKEKEKATVEDQNLKIKRANKGGREEKTHKGDKHKDEGQKWREC